ncbi:MAG: alpha/beta fold hydrolase [Acidobacteria bacterium]|nr:alpha/beta fold hydrolase [Acidobacteriota bacterium]MBI3423831.1 alpha/beta fold hydrolase [Acidobacteriota bacterium]
MQRVINLVLHQAENEGCRAGFNPALHPGCALSIHHLQLDGVLGALSLCLILLCASATAQNAAPKLQLEPCRLAGWNEDVRCGRYEVFEDRKAQAGRKIALKIVVLPALNGKALPDPIFYFTGGPGGSSTETIARAGKTYLASLRRERDLVFVDQRGTGGSNPLPCNLYPDKNDMAAYFSEVLSVERMRACRTELEKVADLKLYSTPTALDDLDEVRAALGYAQINLYGGSYGSTAALAYLRQYPQHVRTVTILGVAPPDMKLPLPALKGVQNAVERVFADCAAEEKCHAAFPNLKAELATALQQLEKAPAKFETVNPFTRQPAQIAMSRSAFAEMLRTLLYQPATSRWVPLLVHQAAAGEFGLFASVAYQSFRGIEDVIARGMHFSVVCGEDLPFITDADLAREKAGSFYGAARVQAYRKVCEFWPHANVSASFTTPVKSDKPVLLISGEADPVAPPWLAAEAAKHLPNGRHLMIPHTGHFFAFPCVDKLVAEFVTQGSAKELDAACVSAIRPQPFMTEELLNEMAQQQTASSKQLPAANEERWEGVLEAGQQKLRLILRLAKAADGKLSGKLDSPDQDGLKDLPISTLTLKEGKLRFEMNLIGASYEGNANSAGTEFIGQWQQSGLSLPLTFKRLPASK